MKHSVNQISVTGGVGDCAGRTAEEMMLYQARVSSQREDKFDDFSLLRWLLKQNPPHISPFQMAHMGIEIHCALDVAEQFKRHWSIARVDPLDLQEFSMRYAKAREFDDLEFRTQGDTNRQVGNDTHRRNAEFQQRAADLLARNQAFYEEMIECGVALESARRILPVYTMTSFFVSGSVRSWLSYISQRNHAHAQKEHRALAADILKIFQDNFPITASVAFGDAA